MIESKWVTLIDYAILHGISPSTVRRKIKTNSIEFRLDNGRYLLNSQSAEATGSISGNNVKSGSMDSVVKYASDSLQSLKEAHQAVIAQRDHLIEALKVENRRLSQENNELKMLVEVMEKRPTQ